MKQYIIFALLIAFTSSLFAQQDVPFDKKRFANDKDNFKEAMKQLKAGDEFYEMDNYGSYMRALEFYLKANQFNPDNAMLNYKIGTSYLYSTQQEKSLPYFQKAYKLNNRIAGDINYKLAGALHLNLKFDEAIKEYNNYKRLLSPKDLATLRKKIDKKIDECNIGKKLVSEPVRVFIDNVGPNINGPYPDYSPLITADASMLIYTSRREGTTGGEISEDDGNYNEDIYISYKQNGDWTPAQNIGKPLNTKDNDATIGLSSDGQKLFTFHGRTNGGEILVAELNGDEWSTPRDKELTKVNSDYHESAASFSFDGKTMYFVSDNPENNLGNHDIFISYWDDNKERWGEPQNLSNTVNSEYDERGVFMHPDGRTLFFSSDGKGSMGGFDIFKTHLTDEGFWSEPENLGYPINTPGDDRFFVLSGSGKHGYYSSDKEGGFGSHDIYLITFLGPEKPLVMSNDNILIASIANPISETFMEESVEVATMRLTILKGTVVDAFTQEPVEAEIEIVDNDKNEVITIQKSNKSTGKYLVSLPSGKNYGIAVKAEGYLFHSENFDIPSATNYQEVYKDIMLSKMAVGTKIVLKNIFFDYAKAKLRSTSFPELDRLFNLLNEFPEMRIEISGHTDNQGSRTTNAKLSAARAKSVVDYLVQKGIPASRLESQGYAFDQPIAPNDTEEGRQQNRRVEFKVLSN
jgi:outer membrane protein OmpA-like peptidoglycan-associated protein/tetratricopeptide (TPR) repeat protein